MKGLLEDLKMLSKVKAKHEVEKVEPGTMEAWEWIDGWYYKYNEFPTLIQAIYGRMVYKRLVASCNDEQLYDLMKHIENRGLDIGMYRFLLDRQMKLKFDRQRKEFMIDQILKQEESNLRELDKKLKEEEIESKLTVEERVKRHAIGIPTIEEIMKQKIIEKEIDSKLKASYIIFDKLYGRYHAIISSPSRILPDGKYGCVHIMEEDLDSMKRQVKEKFRHERARQMGYESREVKSKTKREVRQAKEVDISHVRRIMGMENDDFAGDDLNSDEIF